MRSARYPLMVLGVVLAACAPRSDSHGATLYDRLGGMQGINALTEAMLDRFAADPRVAPQFEHVDIRRFKTQFGIQICDISGGPCKYAGDDLADVHRGMHIGESQFNAVVEDLIAAMDERHISVRVQNELLALLAPMRGDVIHH